MQTDTRRASFRKLLEKIATDEYREAARLFATTFKAPPSEVADAILYASRHYVEHGSGARQKLRGIVAGALLEDPLSPLERQVHTLSRAYRRSVLGFNMILHPREVIDAFRQANKIEKDYLNR